ncbi:MAG: DUF512 domain-containing protein [Microthrixaceae bacterium]
MSAPVVVAVVPESPAALAGLEVGDELVTVNGQAIRDVIQWRVLTDEAEVHLELKRGGLESEVELSKAEGAPLGVEVDAAVFDRVRTCDNHCEFCFITQLPPGMRRSLSLRDDDYRLSFLYGNFTTLTRFTEADLERVLIEGLSPLYVSIHATDPHARTDMLRNPRGATSLRWLRALLDAGVEVHGQVVVCPGVNDGAVLEDTLAGVLEEYPGLADVALVPLGVSRYNTEARMRPHSTGEARAVVAAAERWAEVAQQMLGRRMFHVADEYYLLAGVPFPSPEAYEGFSMHEDGIGMARAFEAELTGISGEAIGVQPGFFAWVDGAPAEGYRAPRWEGGAAESGGCGAASFGPAGGSGTTPPGGIAHDSDSTSPATPVNLGPRRSHPEASRPTGVLTGPLGAAVLVPLLEPLGLTDVRVIAVENRFFGGNVGVTGLMVGEDLVRTLANEPEGHRYLLPDVCLSQGRFLDGLTPAELPRIVEVVPTDGVALRAALGLDTRTPAGVAS